MRPFEARISYDAPAGAVATMLADPAFVERKVAASGPVRSSVAVTPRPDGGVTVTTERSLPTDDLPPAARNFIGATIDLRLVESWGPTQPDGSRAATIRLDVVGRPAGATGTARLRAIDGDRSEIVYEGAVEARIPLVGRRIEEQAAQQVQQVLEAERAVGAAWLAQP